MHNFSLLPGAGNFRFAAGRAAPIGELVRAVAPGGRELARQDDTRWLAWRRRPARTPARSRRQGNIASRDSKPQPSRHVTDDEGSPQLITAQIAESGAERDGA